METGLLESLSVGDQTFTFELCRKPNEVFGTVSVDQWWMEVTPLYAQRQNRKWQSRNHRQVIDFYWAICQAEQATGEREAQQRFLLASLLPHMRSQGSRKVFDDAFLKGGGRDVQAQEVAELENLLNASRDHRLTKDEFHEKTIALLRDVTNPPPDIDPMIRDLSNQILGDACRQLGRGSSPQEGIEIAKAAWDRLNKQFGRRAHCDVQKLALDALTYEARTAIHDCFSMVWYALKSSLEIRYELSQTSVRFLRIWNTSIVEDREGQNWWLFHGHVFGLHPGAARFLLTSTGRQLIGDLLSDWGNESRCQQLLNGLFISMSDYNRRRIDERSSRRQRARTNLDIENLNGSRSAQRLQQDDDE